MRQVNVHQAKTQLSQLMAAAEQGEEIVIARAGKPAVKLVPIQPASAEPGVDPRWPNRRAGALKGKIRYADDWDSPRANAELWAEHFGQTVDEYLAEEVRLRRASEEKTRA